MAYGMAITSGIVLAALLIGCYLTRSPGSRAARLLRRSALFLASLFLVSLLFSLHQAWFEATVNIVKASVTIGQLEEAIDKVGMPPSLHAALRAQNATVLAAVLFAIAALVLVRSGIPCLGVGRRAAAGVGVSYVAVTVAVAGALLGQDAVRDIDAGIARLKAHVEDIELKARDYQRDVEEEARKIVRDVLLQVLDVASIQQQLRVVRASLSAAQEEIEPYRELFQPDAGSFRGATLESDFAGTWHDIRRTVDALYWDRRPVEPAMPVTGRSTWSTLRLYEAGTELRNHRLSRPKVEVSELQDVVARIFDVVFSTAGKTELDAALDVDHGYPLAPLLVSLVEVWHEPLRPLLGAQAEALFEATVEQRQPFADATAAARARVREAMTPLKANLQPGLDQVARRLQRLQGEAARLPQSFRRFAEAAFPERLQAFRRTWHRLLSFSSPAAARAATALRQKTEAVLHTLPDPVRKHEQIAAYERTLLALARGVNDPARYQALLRLEQQHFDTRDFARFTRDQVESRLAMQNAPGNGGPPESRTLPQMETRSQWLEAHRLAVDGLLDEAKSGWQAEDRERILSHLAFDLRFLIRAIGENYKTETYTPEALRDRIRGYGKLAAALEPAELQGSEFIDTAFGNITGSSARGALRFQVVDLIARMEARLRLTPSGIPLTVTTMEGQLPQAPPATSVQLAELLRAERDHIAVYQNASEESYEQALLALWREADRQPEQGAGFSASVVDSLEQYSRRLEAPAQGALSALRRLVRQSNDKARELTRMGREQAVLEGTDDALEAVFATSYQQFLSLQEQIRRHWASARRKLHIRGAQQSR